MTAALLTKSQGSSGGQRRKSHKSVQRLLALGGLGLVLATFRAEAAIELDEPLKPADLPEFAQPLSVFSVSAPDYYTGTYRHSIPIVVGPARNNLVPRLTLEYSGTDADLGGPLGFGWSLGGLDRIWRSTNNGVPKYFGPGSPGYDDRLEYEIAGERGELVPEARGVFQFYRPKREISLFAKFAFSHSRQRWMVYTRDGIVRVLGTQDAVELHPDAPFDDEPYAWYVRKITDPDGNYIEYKYDSDGGALYPNEIRYDQNPNFPRVCGAGGIAPPNPAEKGKDCSPRIVFKWDKPGTDAWAAVVPPPTFERGYPHVRNARILREIEVLAFDEAGNGSSRKYVLSYAGPGYIDEPTSIAKLETVEASGLPKSEFQYTPSRVRYAQGFSNFQAIYDPDPSTAGYEQSSLSAVRTTLSEGLKKRRRTLSMVLDVDADGDLDMLWVISHHDHPEFSFLPINNWFLRLNEGDSKWSNARQVMLPDECYVANLWGMQIALAEPPPTVQAKYDGCHPDALSLSQHDDTALIDYVQDIKDMNGDGYPDLVFVRKYLGPERYAIRVCPGSWDWSAATLKFTTCTSYLTRVTSLSGYIPSLYRKKYTWRWGPAPSPGENPYVLTQIKLGMVTTHKLMDFNGDGILDHVGIDYGSSDHWWVDLLGIEDNAYFHPLARKVQVPDCKAIYAASVTNRWDYSCIEYETVTGCGLYNVVELNGDKLPDILLRPKSHVDWGGFQFLLGTQVPDPNKCAAGLEDWRAHWGTGANYGMVEGITQHTYLDLQSESVMRSDPFTDQDASRETAGFIDMNGDGFADHVEWAESDTYDWKGAPGRYLYVRLNRGKYFGITTAWDLCIACSMTPAANYPVATSGLSATKIDDEWAYLRQALMDFDGDGYVDLVAVPAEGSDTPYLVFSSFHVQPPYRLSKATTGSGWETEVTYGKPHQINTSVPFPLWPVSSVWVKDSVTGKYRIDAVKSYNPLYDGNLREFRGYDYVRVENTGKRVDHYFLQGEWNRGLENIIKVFDLASQRGPILRKKVETTFEHKALMLGRQWWRPKQTETSIYDPGAPVWTQSTKFSYYDGEPGACTYSNAPATLGLLKEEVTGPAGSERKRLLSYVCNDTQSALSAAQQPPGQALNVRARREDTIDASSGAIEARTTWQYDSECEPPPSPGSFGAGKVCRERVYRAPSSPAVTHTRYDDNGRAMLVTDPDGVQRSFKYHGNTPFLAAEISAPGILNHTLFYRKYDALSGKPGEACGPQYVSDPEEDKCDLTTYDAWGRPLEVWLALDDDDGGYVRHKIKTFEYDDEFHGPPVGAPFFKVTEYPDPREYSQPPPRERIVYLDAWGNVIQEDFRLTGTPLTPDHSKNYFAYDSFNRLTKAWAARMSTKPHFEAFSAPEDYLYQYDVLDRLISVRDPAEKTAVAVYNGSELVLRDETQRPTVYERNAFGEVTSMTRYDDAGTILNRTFGYDAAGRLISAVDEDGGVYTYTYYKDGMLRQAYLPSAFMGYDRTPSGQIRRAIKGNGDYVEYDDFDALARPGSRRVVSTAGSCPARRETVEQFSYDVTPKQIGYLGRVEGTKYSEILRYDARGYLEFKSLIDHAGDRSISYRKEHNALGEEVRRTYPSGNGLRFQHNTAGQVNRIALWPGHEHRLLPDPRFGADDFEYEPDGLIKSFRGWLRPSNLVTGPVTASLDFKLQYDYGQPINGKERRLEAVTTTIGGKPRRAAYFYEDNGLISSMSDASRYVNYSWEYDAASRLKDAFGYVHSGAGTPYHYRFVYNKNGSIHGIEENGVPTTTHVYASALNDGLVQINDGADVWHYSIEPGSGERCEETFAGGAGSYERSLGWTGDGLLSRVSQTTGTGAFSGTFNTEYEYDHTGARWRREHDGAATLSLDGLIDYDVEGSHTKIEGFELGTLPPNAGTGGEADWLVTDKLPSWLEISAPPYPSDMVLVPYGRYAAASGNVSSGGVSWLRLSEEVAANGTVQFRFRSDSAGGPDHFLFYIDGQLQDTLPQSLQWQQSKIYSVSAGKHVFEWRYEGKSAPGTPHHRVWLDEIEIANAAGGLREYVEMPGGTICTLPGNEQHARCFFMDLMNTAYVYADDGQVIHEYSYEPYGKQIVLTGSDDYHYGFNFNGKRGEPRSLLIHYGARYYDPVAKEWLSVDPSRMAGAEDPIAGTNALGARVYAASNPTSLLDVEGLAPRDAGGGPMRLARQGPAGSLIAQRQPQARSALLPAIEPKPSLWTPPEPVSNVGKPFHSEMEAAIAALKEAYGPSVSKDRELGGWVYRKSGFYYFTRPTNVIKDPKEAATRSLLVETGTVPGTIVAGYHTHGATEPGYVGKEELSPTDIRAAHGAKRPEYLGTPSGAVVTYRLARGRWREERLEGTSLNRFDPANMWRSHWQSPGPVLPWESPVPPPFQLFPIW